MQLGLSDKVVLITGAAGGVGRATAKAFAGEGAWLALTDRRSESLEPVLQETEDLGAKGVGLTADVSDDGSVRSLVRRVYETFGRVDVLVNIASVSALGDFLELGDLDWSRRLDVKLMGYVRCMRAVIPGMRKQGGGRIINLGGVPFQQVTPTNAIHTASNAGIVQITRLLAAVYAPDRILINTVHPTTMAQGTGAPEAQQLGGSLATRIGRPLLAEDVAKAILFFASDLAECITGQQLAVDGGQMAGMGY